MSSVTPSQDTHGRRSLPILTLTCSGAASVFDSPAVFWYFLLKAAPFQGSASTVHSRPTTRWSSGGRPHRRPEGFACRWSIEVAMDGGQKQAIGLGGPNRLRKAAECTVPAGWSPEPSPCVGAPLKAHWAEEVATVRLHGGLPHLVGECPEPSVSGFCQRRGAARLLVST